MLVVFWILDERLACIPVSTRLFKFSRSDRSTFSRSNRSTFSRDPTDPPSQDPTDPPSQDPTDPPSQGSTDLSSQDPTNLSSFKIQCCWWFYQRRIFEIRGSPWRRRVNTVSKSRP